MDGPLVAVIIAEKQTQILIQKSEALSIMTISWIFNLGIEKNRQPWKYVLRCIRKIVEKILRIFDPTPLVDQLPVYRFLLKILRSRYLGESIPVPPTLLQIRIYHWPQKCL